MTSEAEKERITQKIVSNTIGDMSSLEAMAVDIEKREAAAGGELSDQNRLAILAEHGNAMEDLGALMEKSSSLSSIQSGSGDAELDQRLAELMQKQMEGPPNPLINYNKILGKNAAVLKNLYARLCNTDDRQRSSRSTPKPTSWPNAPAAKPPSPGANTWQSRSN